MVVRIPDSVSGRDSHTRRLLVFEIDKVAIRATTTLIAALCEASPIHPVRRSSQIRSAAHADCSPTCSGRRVCSCFCRTSCLFSQDRMSDTGSVPPIIVVGITERQMLQRLSRRRSPPCCAADVVGVSEQMNGCCEKKRNQECCTSHEELQDGVDSESIFTFVDESSEQETTNASPT